jgi:hypothetical protein
MSDSILPSEEQLESLRAKASEKLSEEKKSPEEVQDQSMKIIRMNQVALNNLVVLDLRNLLSALTAPNTNQAERKQIKESIERAIVMGFDYGVDVVNPTLREHGTLGKLECSFAAHLARLKENGMIIIADNMAKKEKELEQLSAKGENGNEESKESVEDNSQSNETQSDSSSSDQSET